MCFVGVEQLKTALTVLPFIPGSAAGRLAVRLIAVGTKSFAPNGILVATVAARDDECYHAVETKSPWLRHD